MFKQPVTSTEHTIEHPDYRDLEQAVSPRREPVARKRTTPHDAIDRIFHSEGSHMVAFYLEYAITFFVYGVVIAAISLIVFELLLQENESMRVVATLATAGILAIIVGLFVHPWMRKHLPRKEG